MDQTEKKLNKLAPLIVKDGIYYYLNITASRTNLNKWSIEYVDKDTGNVWMFFSSNTLQEAIDRTLQELKLNYNEYLSEGKRTNNKGRSRTHRKIKKRVQE